MIKNKVQIILLLVCITAFKFVNLTSVLIQSGNIKVEIILTTKVTPVVQAPNWLLYGFQLKESAEILKDIFKRH